jgi:hypothetical protein
VNTWRLPAEGRGQAPGTLPGDDRSPTTLELKELDEFLLARTMEHDLPMLLFRPVIRNTGRNRPLSVDDR